MSSPKKIGRFTVIHPLGSGAFASVFLGSDPSGLLVAIKRITRPNLWQLLSNTEVKMMKSYTRHPNLIELIEKIDEFPTLNLVMNYVGKDNLLTYVNREGALTEHVARKLFVQFVSGLEHLHRSGVVHRDLKAENILVSENLSPVICDLGFATNWSKKKFLTKPCGSLHYAAPEIIHGKSYRGPEIDIWSMGVVLYTVIAGHLPWSGEREELVEYICAGDYWFLDRFSVELINLLDMMIEPTPLLRAEIPIIKSSPWFRGITSSSPCKFNLESLNALLPHRSNSISSSESRLSQSFSASGRRSGRSLFSTKTSETVQTIEPSPTFGVKETEAPWEDAQEEPALWTVKEEPSSGGEESIDLHHRLSGVEKELTKLQIEDQNDVKKANFEVIDLRSLNLGMVKTVSEEPPEPNSPSKITPRKWKDRLFYLRSKLSIGNRSSGYLPSSGSGSLPVSPRENLTCSQELPVEAASLRKSSMENVVPGKVLRKNRTFTNL